MTGDEFLRAFYSPPNLTYDFVTTELSQRLRSSLQAVREGCTVPVFLPMRKRQDGTGRWYGMLDPARPMRELEDVARTAIAPSFGSVTPRELLATPADATEQLLDRTFGSSWLRIDLRADDKSLKLARSALERQVWNLLRRPDVELRISRTVARIRSDIDLAVAGSDAAAVDRLIEELADIPTVTAENRLYVTVDTYSRSGRHRQVLELEELDRLVQSRPPRQVRLALLASLHAVLTLDGPLFVDLDLLPPFVLPLLGELLEQAPEPETVEQVEALLAALHLTDGRPRAPWSEPHQLLDRLEALSGDPHRWHAVFPPADSSIGKTDTPLAELCRLAESVASVRDVRRVVGDALVLGTSDAASVAARCVQDHAPELRTDPLIGVTVRGLESLAGHGRLLPNSWTEWVAWCSSGEEQLDVRDVVEANAAAWGQISDQELHMLACAVSDASTMTARNLRSALGLVIDNHGTGGSTAPRRRLLLAAIELLAFGGPTSLDERQAVMSWVEELCNTGLDEGDYLGLIEHLAEIWRQVASAGTAEWAVDLLAVVVISPAPSEGAHQRRDGLLHLMVADLRPWLPALDSEVRDTLVGVADLLGVELPGVAKTDAAADPLKALGSRQLAIHTLMVSAAKTSVAAIHKAAPDCRIEVNSDRVATDRLVALAAGADVFALVIAAAKHEASNAVERNRPNTKPLLRVHGKGATALLRELRGAAEAGFRGAG